jgi:hypothetical protein
VTLSDAEMQFGGRFKKLEANAGIEIESENVKRGR